MSWRRTTIWRGMYRSRRGIGEAVVEGCLLEVFKALGVDRELALDRWSGYECVFPGSEAVQEGRLERSRFGFELSRAYLEYPFYFGSSLQLPSQWLCRMCLRFSISIRGSP